MVAEARVILSYALKTRNRTEGSVILFEKGEGGSDGKSAKKRAALQRNRPQPRSLGAYRQMNSLGSTD